MKKKILFVALVFALSWLWPASSHGQVDPSDLLAANETVVTADVPFQRSFALETRLFPGPLTPGAGLPGVPAGFSRYGPGVPAQPSWLGFCCELRPATTTALANACRANYWGTASSYDCRPTVSEEDFLIVYTMRRSDFYRIFWWESQEGGTAARPIVLTTRDRPYESAKKQAGAAFRVGLFSYPSAWGWPLWVDNQVAEIEPPPPPAEDPCRTSLDWLLEQLSGLLAKCDPGNGFCPGAESSGRLRMVVKP